MLPLQQAYEIKQSIIEYLKATFTFRNREVDDAFMQLVTDPEDGITKGPYISLKLPFVTAAPDTTIPLEVKPAFPPYDHQLKSFFRLTTHNGNRPKPTLLTTGTGSGKTESFLYPILDYCYQNRHRRGIKVIILYPMNALASDQAKRLAEAIWEDAEHTKGVVTAGLFIGEGKTNIPNSTYRTKMGENNIVEDRDTIKDNPPDILLTNFKMLDYGLIKHSYDQLWAYNYQDPTLLKFLVLDELHTYDGAQGTDVANLIRRLKLKLNITNGQLCPIGTSATIGSGADSKRLLVEYAQKVFGEQFEEDGVIVENRVSVDEFFSGNLESDDARFLPRIYGLKTSRIGDNETYASYLKRQYALWYLNEVSNPVVLGLELRKLRIVKDILAITSQGIISIDNLKRQLADINPQFRNIPQWDDAQEFSPRDELINSILALISEAKIGKGKHFPMLYLQVQLWVREFSGILREVGQNPKFTWKDKVDPESHTCALPPYFCRECGASGWVMVKGEGDKFNKDASKSSVDFINKSKNVWLVNTEKDNHLLADDYTPTDRLSSYISKEELTIAQEPSDDSVKVWAVRKVDDNHIKHICPECNTENVLALIGTKIPTLSSISVSQVESSNLDKSNEQKRKVLAFTNSVQDAAHQAGFIEARNYRFTFRSSLQKVINQFEEPLTLEQLQAEFIDYWKKNVSQYEEKMEEAYVYRFFPSDYLGKVNLRSDYRANGKFFRKFMDELDLRIKWEIASEFGFNATIGRTLEKMGASSASFDTQRLRDSFLHFKPWLESNGLFLITEADYLAFVQGMLHRMRIKGAVDHEYLNLFREKELKIWDLNWGNNPLHFLNRTYDPRKSRLPKVVTTVSHSRGVADSTFTKQLNWFHSYFRKSFITSPADYSRVNDFYQELFKTLCVVGVLSEAISKDGPNYCIKPQAIIISKQSAKHQCTQCTATLTAGSDTPELSNVKCLNYSCTGSYATPVNIENNYYKSVYNRELSPRIYASEHTGMLERNKREFIEREFKNRPNFNSYNVLVATSTLEMGIDIGDLNTTFNNSIPPLPSNFMQRVGRAGRKTGAALIVNFAQKDAHDLAFYEAPLKMMEGDILTPGCFLEAKEILNRHFLAFCFDSWAKSDPSKNLIPNRIDQLKLTSINLSDISLFFNKLINFTRGKEVELVEKFQSQFVGLKEEIFDNLLRSLTSGAFELKIRQEFDNLWKEIHDINKKIIELSGTIKSKKLQDTDPEYIALTNERKSLYGQRKLIQNQLTLEFMTNVGLLPNYAFPETGVTLRANIYSRKPKDSDSAPEVKNFEIVRSASSAIRELAPDNSFYSQGYKLPITGINTFNWNEGTSLLTMKFCSKCDALYPLGEGNTTSCPKCGDQSYSAKSNEHIFVKMEGVKSVSKNEDAALDDSSDDRDKTKYRISRHFDFDNNSVFGSWGMQNIPFGIEYCKHVTLTEVNLAQSEIPHARHIDINGLENVPTHGFVTCRTCGRSSSYLNRNREPADWHFPFCKHKEVKYEGGANTIFEEVYLYRELQTEALKILLPVQEIDSDAMVEMFKAGIELGLRKYYNGNPDHIAIRPYKEYNANSQNFDRYLVMYDTIPGGTGYLETLFGSNEFIKLLKLAHEAICNCSCQLTGKDGCHKCILTYSNKYVHGQLSRKRAEGLFERILSNAESWTPFNGGLKGMTSTGQIEESELETRFIRLVKALADKKKQDGWLFEEINEHGIINYSLVVKNSLNTFYYTIRPQIDLGTSDGVSLSTRADFLIRCTAIERNGIEAPLNEIQRIKPIAIYLDGHTYHASKENFNFYKDLKKRRAIVQSGTFLSWTLTWEDLDIFQSIITDDNKKSDLVNNQIDSNTLSILKKGTPYKPYINNLIEANSSVTRLFWFLENNSVSESRMPLIGWYVTSFIENFPRQIVAEEMVSDWLTFKGTPFASLSDLPEAISKKGLFYNPSLFNSNLSFSKNILLVRINDLSWMGSIKINDYGFIPEKEEWNKFWRVYNIIQEQCTVLFPDEVSSVEQSQEQLHTNPDDLLTYYADELHPIVRILVENRINFGKDGSFFLDNGAEAAIGNHKNRVVIDPLSAEDKKVFIDAGYQIITPKEFTLELFQ